MIYSSPMVLFCLTESSGKSFTYSVQANGQNITNSRVSGFRYVDEKGFRRFKSSRNQLNGMFRQLSPQLDIFRMV